MRRGAEQKGAKGKPAAKKKKSDDGDDDDKPDKIVRRELKQVFTNGTIVDGNYLTTDEANHCVSIKVSFEAHDDGSKADEPRNTRPTLVSPLRSVSVSWTRRPESSNSSLSRMMSAGLGSRRCSGRSDPKSSSLQRSAS